MSRKLRVAGLAVSIILLLVAAVPAQDLKSQLPIWAANPDIAAFEKSENARLAAADLSIQAVIAVKGEHTIPNTLAPYDEAIRQLNAASNIAQLQQQVHPDTSFRDHATAMVAKVAGAKTALSLNRDVYAALASMDVSKADQPTRYYVQRTLLEFHLAGVDKDEATRARLKQLNDQLTDE
jgi:thimet oligopeptidase